MKPCVPVRPGPAIRSGELNGDSSQANFLGRDAGFAGSVQANWTRSDLAVLDSDTNVASAAVFKVSTQGVVHNRLRTFWSADRQENATVADPFSVASTRDFYIEVGEEGWLPPDTAKGVVALELYWNNERQDNALVSTGDGHASMEAYDYELIRREGYVYTTQQPGTVPLELWWSSEREDNISIASQASRDQVIAAGYEFVRIQGYIYPI